MQATKSTIQSVNVKYILNEKHVNKIILHNKKRNNLKVLVDYYYY